MKKFNLLSKAEMKKVLGGELDNTGTLMCVYCITSDGSSCWYRRNTSEDALDICREIYHKATINEYGYSECLPHCIMN